MYGTHCGENADLMGKAEGVGRPCASIKAGMESTPQTERKDPAEFIDVQPAQNGIVQKNIDALLAGDQVQLKSELDSLTIWEAWKTYKWSVFICSVAAFSAAVDGYQLNLNGGIVANAGFIQQFGWIQDTGKLALWPTAVSCFGGLSSAGFVIGQSLIFLVADAIGRKYAMFVFTTILTISIIVESVSTIWWHWAIAKLICGIGIGSVQVVLNVYINEHAPVQIRGFLIVAYSAWFTLGGLLASIGLSVTNVRSPYDWKTPVYTQFAFVGLAYIIYVFLPETPWWLVSKGKLDRARAVLLKKNGSIPNYDVEQELAIIAATLEKQKLDDEAAKSQGSFDFLKGINGKRFFIGAWPKQFVGLSVFSSYSTYFFQLAGNANPFNVTIILGCVSLIATFLDAYFVDRIGRRRMTLFGFGGACVGISLMAIVGCFDYTSPQLGSLLVFAGVIANFCNTFQSSTSYAYLTEMPEQRFRARAVGFGLAACNCFATLFSFTVPLMLKVWVVKTAFFFMGLGIPGTVLAYFIMPESMNRSPAEIQELFVERVPLRKWKGYKTSVERDLEERMGQVEA